MSEKPFERSADSIPDEAKHYNRSNDPDHLAEHHGRNSRMDEFACAFAENILTFCEGEKNLKTAIPDFEKLRVQGSFSEKINAVVRYVLKNFAIDDFDLRQGDKTVLQEAYKSSNPENFLLSGSLFLHQIFCRLANVIFIEDTDLLNVRVETLRALSKAHRKASDYLLTPEAGDHKKRVFVDLNFFDSAFRAGEIDDVVVATNSKVEPYMIRRCEVEGKSGDGGSGDIVEGS